jgi:hypothetical protein
MMIALPLVCKVNLNRLLCVRPGRQPISVPYKFCAMHRLHIRHLAAYIRFSCFAQSKETLASIV